MSLSPLRANWHIRLPPESATAVGQQPAWRWYVMRGCSLASHYESFFSTFPSVTQVSFSHVATSVTLPWAVCLLTFGTRVQAIFSSRSVWLGRLGLCCGAALQWWCCWTKTPLVSSVDMITSILECQSCQPPSILIDWLFIWVYINKYESMTPRGRRNYWSQ